MKGGPAAEDCVCVCVCTHCVFANSYMSSHEDDCWTAADSRTPSGGFPLVSMCLGLSGCVSQCFCPVSPESDRLGFFPPSLEEPRLFFSFFFGLDLINNIEMSEDI